MCAKKTVPEASVNILVVDDEKDVRNLYVAVLNEEGNNVTSASTGVEAVKKIKSEKPDMVILDLKMPDMHGTEVLEQVEDMINGTLVIIATAYPSLESSLEAIKVGVYDYIVKPFSPQDLRTVVQRAAERIRLVKKNKQLIEELEEKNRELREKISQLEKFTKAAVDREEKMADLKAMIKELEERLRTKG